MTNQPPDIPPVPEAPVLPMSIPGTSPSASRSGFFGDGTGRLRTVWRLMIAWAAMAVFFVVAIVVLLLAFVVAQIVMRGTPLVDWHFEEPDKLFLGIIIIPVTLGLTGLLLLLRRYLDRRPIRSMGFYRTGPNAFSSIWLALLLGAFPILGTTLVLWAVGSLRFLGPGDLFEPGLLVPVLIVAAFMEEIMCRGYSYQNFLDIRRPVVGVIVTSTIFWLMHSLNNEVWSSPIPSINLFLAGVELALAYQVSRNIWFPTALHFSWNYVQGAVFGFPVSGNEVNGLVKIALDPETSGWLSGGAFGLEGSVLITLGELVTIALFLWVLHTRRQTNSRDGRLRSE